MENFQSNTRFHIGKERKRGEKKIIKSLLQYYNFPEMYRGKQIRQTTNDSVFCFCKLYVEAIRRDTCSFTETTLFVFLNTIFFLFCLVLGRSTRLLNSDFHFCIKFSLLFFYFYRIIGVVILIYF